MNTVAVFARRPVAGAVKTRLAPSLPAPQAVLLYRGMLADALAAAQGAGADSIVLWWAGEPDEGSTYEVPAGVAIRTQAGDDLGERLASAFAGMLASPAHRAVAIGADCPDLTPALIREAFAALDHNDLVLGPARDGGYYLIGLRRPAPALFRGVSWGTDHVLAETRTRAAAAGLSQHTLEPLADLDTPEDLVGFIARRSFAPSAPGAGTEAALRELGLLPSF